MGLLETEVHQPPFVVVEGYPVADALGSLWCDRSNRCSNFPELAPSFLGSCVNVGVYAFRLSTYGWSQSTPNLEVNAYKGLCGTKTWTSKVLASTSVSLDSCPAPQVFDIVHGKLTRRLESSSAGPGMVAYSLILPERKIMG